MNVGSLFGYAETLFNNVLLTDANLAIAVEGRLRSAQSFYPIRRVGGIRAAHAYRESYVNSPFRTWHGDFFFERLVNEIMIAFGVRYFVETGTYLGETTRYIASRYPDCNVLTCEIDPIRCEAARILSANHANIRIQNATSPIFLRKLIPQIIDTLPVFWLDAHWGNTFPLREECKIISNLTRYVAIIDDFFVPGRPEFGCDSHRETVISLDLVSDLLSNSCFVPNYAPNMNGRPKEAPPKGYGVFFNNVEFLKLKTLDNLKEISTQNPKFESPSLANGSNRFA